jgi:hypothetical protein
MTRGSGSGSSDGKRPLRDRIVDVPAGSRTVDVATHAETLEFMKTLKEIVRLHPDMDKRGYKEALRVYLAGVEPEKRKRLARGIMAALPGPRPSGQGPTRR